MSYSIERLFWIDDNRSDFTTKQLFSIVYNTRLNQGENYEEQIQSSVILPFNSYSLFPSYSSSSKPWLGDNKPLRIPKIIKLDK